MPSPDSSSQTRLSKDEAQPFLASDAESDTYSQDTGPPQRPLRCHPLHSALPWMISTCGLATALLVVLMVPSTPPLSHSLGSYEHGFRTDAVLHRPIPLKVIRWSGNPHFDDEKQAVMPSVNTSAPWPDNHLYVGPPSHEIDVAWQHLIGNRYFSISEKEAVRAWGASAPEYANRVHGGWTAGLEVFHLLHCVNRVRKALHPEYYPPPPAGPGHIDHCIEVLREAIQCWGPTTLVPAKYDPVLGHHYANSDQLHTCRDINIARRFSTERQRGGNMFVPYPDEEVNKTHSMRMM